MPHANHANRHFQEMEDPMKTYTQLQAEHEWAHATLAWIASDVRKYFRDFDNDGATDNFVEAMRAHMEDIREYRRNHKIRIQPKP